jgi:hypothetical protein
MILRNKKLFTTNGNIDFTGCLAWVKVWAAVFVDESI